MSLFWCPLLKRKYTLIYCSARILQPNIANLLLCSQQNKVGLRALGITTRPAANHASSLGNYFDVPGEEMCGGPDAQDAALNVHAWYFYQSS